MVPTYQSMGCSPNKGLYFERGRKMGRAEQSRNIQPPYPQSPIGEAPGDPKFSHEGLLWD